MSGAQIPINPNLTLVVGQIRVFRLAARIIEPGNGTFLSNTGNGTRLGRFRITTTASSFTRNLWNMEWNFNQATYGYSTIFQAVVGGVPVNVTVPSYHFNQLLGPCLSCYQNYEARLLNDTQINPYTYEFDIYYKDTGNMGLVTYGLQVCLLINDSISNGGVLNSTYIQGTSEMSPAQIPDNPDISNPIGGKRVWKLAAKQTNISLSTTISAIGIGTRLGRFRITTSAPSFAYLKPNLNWNFDSFYGYKTVTEVFWYNAPQASYICTDALDHYNNLSNPILPVELISFSANLLDHKRVVLNWSTATETNNYGFEVQRKVISQQSTVSNDGWEKIGFVAGSGNSSSTKNYSYVDNNLTGGSKFAYRLKQIDNNGTFNHSSIQTIELELKDYVLSQNYPNPFNPTTTIEYIIPKSGNVTLIVYDLLGEKIDEVLNEHKEIGIYRTEYKASKLTSGVYVYVLRSNGNTISKKMIVTK